MKEKRSFRVKLTRAGRKRDDGFAPLRITLDTNIRDIYQLIKDDSLYITVIGKYTDKFTKQETPIVDCVIRGKITQIQTTLYLNISIDVVRREKWTYENHLKVYIEVVARAPREKEPTKKNS